MNEYIIKLIMDGLLPGIVSDAIYDFIKKGKLDNQLESSFDRAKKRFKDKHLYFPVNIKSYKDLNLFDDNEKQTSTELLELFKDELRNNVQTYLWYIEQLICNNHNSERLSNFIELDERRNYINQNDFFIFIKEEK